MNSPTRRKYHRLAILFFVIWNSSSYCQSKQLSFEKKSLQEVLESLEQNYNYVFNYDPELLGSYYFSGKVDGSNVRLALTKILYNTPLNFEQDQNTFLLYYPEQKRYRICGTLLDLQSEETLVAANITAIGTSSGSESDAEGYFDFEITSDKNQKIELSYLGYKTISFTAQDVQKGECPRYEMSIDEVIIGKEILITDYIIDGIDQGDDYGSFVFDYSKLSKNHSNVEHDILKTAQLLPGINSIDDSATNLQIRGNNPDQNLILWEGAPVYNAGHIFGMISAINPFSVQKVHIYKGAHDPKYDNRVGGIMDISLPSEIDTSIHGSIGSTLTEVHSNLSIPITSDRLSLLLCGRKSIRGIYNSPPLQSYTDKVFQLSIIDDIDNNIYEGSFDTEQMLNYYDHNAKLLLKASDKIDISLGAYGNNQDFQYSYLFEGDPFKSEHRIFVDTKLINGSIDIQYNPKWSSLLRWYNSSYSNVYKIKESEGEQFLEEYNQSNAVSEQDISLSHRYIPTKKIAFNIGYEYNTKDIDLDLGEDIVYDPEFVIRNNEIISFQNLFFSMNHTSQRFKLDLGIRSSYYQERLKWLHSPRLNLQYSITDFLKLKADAGIYHQFITQTTNFGIRQIRVDNPLWILNSSNSQLSQQALKVAAGIIFRKNGWLVDIDAYFNHTDGVSTITPLFGIASSENGFSRGSSTAKGIDILVKKKWSFLNTWINYSTGIIENNFPDISEDSFYAPGDIRHNLNVVTSYKIKQFQFSLNSNVHSGLPYTLPEVEMNEDPEAEHPFIYYLDYHEFNNRRLSPYLRFDINVNYKFNFRKISSLNSELSLSLINVFNSENTVAREYYIDIEDMSTNPALLNVNKVLLRRTPLAMLRFYW